MKKIYSFAMLAAVAAAALVSCAKEMEKPEVMPQNEGIQFSVTTERVNTKTALGAINGNKQKIEWQDTDAVGFFNHAADVNCESMSTFLEGESATFSGSVPTTGTYYAYYPYQADTYAPDAEGVTVRILNSQYPTPASFDPKADLLVSTPFEVTDVDMVETPIEIQFRRLASFIRIQFVDKTTGSVLADEYAANVGIQGEANLSGRFKISGTEGLIDKNSGNKKITAYYDADTYKLTQAGQYAYFGVKPQTFATGSTLIFTASVDNYNISKEVTLPKDVVLEAGDILPISVSIEDANLTPKSVAIKTVWSSMSEGSTAWNEYYGGTGGTDRNIAMDDEYVYIAENAATAKLWAISIADKNDVTAVNVEGVEGGTHVLACPRVVPNTDPAINDGKDVLICSNLTRGGEEPKLYVWDNGIANPPSVIELITSATGAWYGDVFTVYGTFQDGILFFDKTGGENVNGIVTFDLDGTIPAKKWLHKRIDFNSAIGSHSGSCAYYPFPGNPNEGIYSPGRGIEKRGQSAVITGDLKSAGNSAFTPELTPISYSSGRNGYVLGYNFVEWRDNHYVIYGKQESSTAGHVYVLEGPNSLPFLTILNREWDGGEVKFRRDILRAEGCSLTSSANAMDIAVRIINGDIYIAAQKQNIGCALYRVCYE